MRAAVLTAVGRLEVQDVPEPRCGPGDVALRVEVCAICGTDLKFFRYGHRTLTPPLVLGHEFAGEVIEVGAEVEGYAPGDRVVMSPSGYGCGSCFFCRRGRDELCGAYRGLGGKGGFAEQVLVPERMVRRGNLHHVPDGLSERAAALTEPLACLLNSHDRLDLRRDEPVVVLGAGPIGIMHAMLCRAAGCSPLVVTDVDASRLAAVPAELGAVRVESGREDVLEVVRGVTAGLGAATVIVAAPSPRAQQEALHLVRKGGTVCYFAGLPVGTKEVPIDTNRIHYDQITVFGTSNCGVDHSRRALSMLAAGIVDPDVIITHAFPLERAVEAFEFAEGRTGLKVAVIPGGARRRDARPSEGSS
jgi:L-iditol 2-dehydrogenase